MPLFFASSAIYPIALLPAWLQVVAALNPLTHMVGAVRNLMVVPDFSGTDLAIDFAAMGIAVAALLFIASRLYPRAGA